MEDVLVSLSSVFPQLLSTLVLMFRPRGGVSPAAAPAALQLRISNSISRVPIRQNRTDAVPDQNIVSRLLRQPRLRSDNPPLAPRL